MVIRHALVEAGMPPKDKGISIYQRARVDYFEKLSEMLRVLFARVVD